jgi:hypothetical protein
MSDVHMGDVHGHTGQPFGEIKSIDKIYTNNYSARTTISRSRTGAAKDSG